MLVTFIIASIQLLYAQTDQIKDLSLLNVDTKNEVNISGYKNKKAIAVIFFCNNCPYSTFYIDRIKAFAKNYQDVQFLLINSSNSDYVPEESESNMVSFLKENEIGIPYLMDKDKTAMKAFGAKRCPESFVITPGNWQIVYHGAIDNNPQVAADVSEHYLTGALDNILRGGQPPSSFERPSGCIIK